MRRRRLIAAIVLSAAPLLTQRAFAGIVFLPGETVDVAPLPDYVLAGDLNADRRDDIVVVSPSSREVGVFLAADTAAVFAPAPSLHFGNTLSGPALGDLNCDDRLDLIVADQRADGVWVLLNAGDGTFLPPYLVDVPGSRAPASVALGDFDGVGSPDLAVADPRVDRVFIALNDNGNPPHFRAAGEIQTGIQPSPVHAADLNGDGHEDLITLNSGGPRVKDLSVVLSLGPAVGVPAFATQQKYTVGERPEAMLLGDFNDDGATDVALLNRPAGGGNSQVYALLNQGNGVLSPPLITGIPCPFFTGGQPCKALALTLGDFDDNGMVDLMVALADPRRSRGSASSLADAMQAFAGRGDGTFVPSSTAATGKSPRSMTAGDFNGDDRIDVAVANARTLDLQAFINLSRPGSVLINGAPCSRDDQCLSTLCTDGVCCAAVCDPDELCNVPSYEGSCTPRPRTPVPCTLPEPVCGDGSFCADGYCCDQECAGGRCDIPGFEGVCIPGVEVGFPCEDSRECASGFCARRICCLELCEAGFCDDTGVCGPRTPDGEICAVDAQCESGVCDLFDAICCNRRCDAREGTCVDGTCRFGLQESFAATADTTTTSHRLRSSRPAPAPITAASKPCGVCPSGTRRENGSCVTDPRDDSGCSVVDARPRDRGALLLFPPLVLWVRRRWTAAAEHSTTA